MNTNKSTSLLKRSVISAFFVLGAILSTTASAAFINFDTLQNGTPYAGLGGSFSASEYNGVVINDSDPTVGSTYVNLTNAVNVGTSISGYYVNVGAFDQTPQTQLNLDFTTAATSVSFDYANPTGNLTVSAFDTSGASLGIFNFSGAGLFVNQAGHNQVSGHVDISGIGNIASILVEPNQNQALIFDNLNFSPVPVPAAAWLFGSGLIGLIGIARRKKA